MSDRDSHGGDYETLYREFDSPLQRLVRQAAYAEDIGQHSWVTADELRADIPRLRLSDSSRLLDLGCGPAGPLIFLVQHSGCRAVGVDISEAALSIARSRAAAAGLTARVELWRIDLDSPVPVGTGTLGAVTAYDVMLHVHDRAAVFAHVARSLDRTGRFLFTDAAVLTGSISAAQIQLRSLHGHTQFTAVGCNERALSKAGFKVLETEDRTESVAQNASGRLQARLAHRNALEASEGVESFQRQQTYLMNVATLARGGILARVMYLAERV
jgi:cyclopropane fatty-acyl-phospholipid synthase-like methyltransferase